MKTQPLVTLQSGILDHYLIFSVMSLELHVKTVKYFKSIERVQEEVEEAQAEIKKLNGVVRQQVGSME
jgi:hypothetical protein